MNALVITRRELFTFFVSPLAYFTAAAFLLGTGIAFYSSVVMHSVATLSRVFWATAMLLVFVAPLLSMRLLSKETHSGTLELLLTAPIRDWEVVIGKFLATFLYFVIILSPTLVYLVLLTNFGTPDIPVTLAGYLGVILLGSMLIGLGVLASSLSANQLVAVVLAIVLSLLFWLIGGLGAVTTGVLGQVLTYLSIQEHFADFLLGLIAVNHIVYFLSVTAGALFIASYVIQVRR
jgi:ABC-2 type transport system permease protein